MFIEVVYVLATYHVDLGVPLTIEGIELGYLVLLRVREVGKVFIYNFHIICMIDILVAKVVLFFEKRLKKQTFLRLVTSIFGET